MKRSNRFLLVGVVGLVYSMLACDLARATALTASRDTPQREGESVSLTMASNVIIYAGSMVCVDTNNGYANPAADTAGFAVIGMAEETVDNRTANYLATRTIKVVRGVFRWENADSIADSDIGKIVYVTDDQTANKTGGGNNIIAGAVVDVDSTGVWVDTGKIGSIGASTPSSLAVSGAATVGTTLTVAGLTTMSANGKISSATANLAFTNTADSGTVDISMKADRADDAGDYWNEELTAAGSLVLQNDHASKGTLATVFTIDKNGSVTLDGGAILDNETSATELNITETAVKVTGTFEVTGTHTVTGASALNGGATISSRAPCLAPSTTVKVVDSGTCIVGAGGAVTQSFTTAYGNGIVPIVTVTPYMAAAVTIHPYVTSSVSNQFVFYGDVASTNMWIAVGTK